MKTGKLGERAFLERISGFVRIPQGSRLGWDEDACDIPIDDSTHIVINVDTFVASTDRLPGMSEAQMGRKLAVMTLSDIVAKGVRPRAMMLSLAVPSDYPADSAEEIVRGLSQYCIKNDVEFVGGDVGTSDDVVLTGVALGTAHPDKIVPRAGARPGDIIAVSGRFGLTSVAFKMLLEGLEAHGSLSQRALIAAYKPVIDFNLVRLLAAQRAVTSAMDCSDGLGITLNTMAAHSNVAFELERIPAAGGVREFAEKHRIDLMDLVMAGGEEFALVITIPEKRWEVAREIAQASTLGLQRIGRVREGSGVTWLSPGGAVPVTGRGYDSFKEWK